MSAGVGGDQGARAGDGGGGRQAEGDAERSGETDEPQLVKCQLVGRRLSVDVSMSRIAISGGIAQFFRLAIKYYFSRELEKHSVDT